jgi:peptide/nickel transport system ATP-binding protein
MNLPLLEVENLVVRFPIRGQSPLAKERFIHAVDNVSFTVGRGMSFGIVGESGSGKSTVALSVMQLVRPSAGSIRLDGTELMTLVKHEMRALRRRMQIVFQDPFSSLNPRARVGAIIREPLDLMRIGTWRERRGRVDALLERVGLRADHRNLFPHQFSGGQRQRIAIARALAPEPEMLVCDEPVSALDVAIQAQILNQLSQLQEELGLTYLFISHDLGVIRQMCDEIAVMYFGQIVESGSRLALLTSPLHPYTRILLASVPSPDPRQRNNDRRLHAVGEPPSPIDPPPGCRFASRCPFVIERCRAEMPAMRAVGRRGQSVMCHRVSDDGIAEYGDEPG